MSLHFDNPRQYIEWADLLAKANDHPGNTLSYDLLSRKSTGWLRSYIERLDLGELAAKIAPYTVEEV